MDIRSLLIISIILLALQSSCSNGEKLETDKKKAAPGGPSQSQTPTQFQPGIPGDPEQIDTAHFTSLNCSPNQAGDSLNVTLIGQEGYWWCWAASGQMVMSALGRNVTQCKQAEDKFGEHQCCSIPPPGACDDTGWPDFEKYGFEADTTHDKALSWEDVKKQINCLKTPFCFSKKIFGSEDDGHMMVVCGYKILDGDSMVLIFDPSPAVVGHQQWYTYASYVSGPSYTHWDDYYNIRRNDN